MVTGFARTSVGRAAGKGVGVASGGVVGRGVGGTRVAAGWAWGCEPLPEPVVAAVVPEPPPVAGAAAPVEAVPPVPVSAGAAC